MQANDSLIIQKLVSKLLQGKDMGVGNYNNENIVIKKSGLYGAIAVMQARNIVGTPYILSNIPTECPWQGFNTINPAKIIDKIFSDIADFLPFFVPALKKQCKHIFTLYKSNTWHLVYCIQIKGANPHYIFLCGGAPNANPTLNNKLVENNWQLPESLRKFYNVHDGFSNLGDEYGMRLLSSNKIIDTDTAIGEIVQEKGIALSYKLTNLLEFIYDGMANAWCFYRKSNTEKDPDTVYWDHETLELSEPYPFFRNVDEILWRLLLPEEECFTEYSEKDSDELYETARKQSDNGNYKAALEAINEAIRLFPNDEAFYELKGTILKKHIGLAEAIKWYEEILLVNKGRWIKVNTTIYSLYLKLAEAYIEYNDFDNACLQAKQVIDLRPENPTAWNICGICNFIQGKYSEAVKDYSNAISLCLKYNEQKRSVTYYGNRAEAYIKLKQYKEAITDCESGFIIEPDNKWLLKVKNMIP